MDYARLVKATINGVELSRATRYAFIQTATESSPEIELTLSDRLSLAGQHYTRAKTKSKEIKLGIIIAELYDLRARARTLDIINEWAQDGILTLSYRPHQQLRVQVTKRPALGSVREWSQIIEVILKAHVLPFWEATTPTQVTITAAANAAGTGNLQPDGNVEKVPVEITVTNRGSAVMNSLTVSAGNTAMVFTGLAIPAGQTLRLFYDDNMILRIATGQGVNKTSCRTAASSDELLASPGVANLCSVSANTPASAIFSARGLWA